MPAQFRWILPDKRPSPDAAHPEYRAASETTARRDARPANLRRQIRWRRRSIALWLPNRPPDDRSKNPSTDYDRRCVALQREVAHCYKHVATDPNWPRELAHAAIFAAQPKSLDIRSPSSPVRQKLGNKVDVQLNALDFLQR